MVNNLLSPHNFKLKGGETINNLAKCFRNAHLQ